MIKHVFVCSIPGVFGGGYIELGNSKLQNKNSLHKHRDNEAPRVDHTPNSAVIRNHYQNILHKRNLSDPIYWLDDLSLEAGLQPEFDMEFPTIEGTRPRIPHILHQVFLTSNLDDGVPEEFLDNVKTFFKHNPNWTYFFWTQRTARALLTDRYPNLLPIFDATSPTVVKGDMLRYVLLYEYGGLYADLDVSNVRHLDIVTMKYPCMLVPEPFEHAGWWYGDPYIIINAIMFCRPKHPLFKQIVDHIPSRQNVPGVVHKLGPGFLTTEYRLYNNITKDIYRIDISQDTTSPYFYKGEIPPTHDNGVYVPNTRYFMDSPSPDIYKTAESECRRLDLSNLGKRICHVIKERGMTRSPGNHTFLTHLWSHTWNRPNSDSKTYTFVSVKNMIKHFTNYFIEKAKSKREEMYNSN